jgi:LytR cell envelope-related transcriptional attenuator
MTPETDTVPPGPPQGGGWVRPVALVASCLVIGFVGGWVLRGDEGPVTVLAPSAPVDSGETGSVTTGGASTAPGATTSTAPGTTPAAPAPPPDRADIRLVVLNGTNENGLAGRIAAQAESLGYSGVTAGNAPTTTSPSIAYFTPGQRPAAQRVARDLEIETVQALPAGGALAAATPEGTDVALVLGPG